MSNLDYRKSLLFKGTCQGVGFRWTCQQIAQTRNLTGWAQNLADGTVAVEIQGNPLAIESWMKKLFEVYKEKKIHFSLAKESLIPTISKEKIFTIRYF